MPSTATIIGTALGSGALIIATGPLLAGWLKSLAFFFLFVCSQTILGPTLYLLNRPINDMLNLTLEPIHSYANLLV